MLLFENIKLALSAIRVNKMRSFLTMLGIIIGISSVIAITSIGDSAKGAVSKEFEGYNAYMYIMVNWAMIEDYVEQDALFYKEDIEALKERFPEDIKYAAPSANASSETKIGRTKGKFQMSGIGDGYLNYDKKFNILYGRGINKSDVASRKDVIVIDVKAAKFFFNKEDVIGKTIPVTILGESKDLTIVGVYKQKESVFNSLNTSTDYYGFIPYSIAMQPGEGTSYIEIYADENKNQATQAQSFANYVSKMKGKQEGFYRYETAESQLGMINKVLGILSVAIGAIAAISLLVGGIGIMNIMLVSVTERTREIGIRKSLGAQTKDILTQFLIEAMILSVIGGIIGTSIGIGIATLGMTIAGVSVVINPGIILTAVAFSAFVGIFFGIFPAKKAAKLDPIEALRYE
ncbi:MAG: ABC transporter permease [Aminipila sp.]